MITAKQTWACSIELDQRPDIRTFRRSIITHKRKVEQLGMQLLVGQSKGFKLLCHRPHIALRYLKLHDLAKLRLQNLLFLYGIYGKSLADMPHSDRHSALEWIQKLNGEEEEIKQGFMSKYHGDEASSLKAELGVLETVADCVARYLDCNSESEFGYKLQPASDFLKCPRQRYFALFLERRSVEAPAGLSLYGQDAYELACA